MCECVCVCVYKYQVHQHVHVLMYRLMFLDGIIEPTSKEVPKHPGTQ